MSNWQKWASRPAYDPDSERIVCVLMVSRNKDNRGVPGFVARRRSYLAGIPVDADPRDRLAAGFATFVESGVPGEASRLYVSVNARDNARVRKLLLERLIFDDGASMAHLQSLLCGLAADHACASEHRWMFDVDPVHGHDDFELARDFVSDVAASAGIDSDLVECHETPNGYAVIVPHGFDTRDVLARWPIATLKRDDLLCIGWERKDADASDGAECDKGDAHAR